MSDVALEPAEAGALDEQPALAAGLAALAVALHRNMPLLVPPVIGAAWLDRDSAPDVPRAGAARRRRPPSRDRRQAAGMSRPPYLVDGSDALARYDGATQAAADWLTGTDAQISQQDPMQREKAVKNDGRNVRTAVRPGGKCGLAGQRSVPQHLVWRPADPADCDTGQDRFSRRSLRPHPKAGRCRDGNLDPACDFRTRRPSYALLRRFVLTGSTFCVTRKCYLLTTTSRRRITMYDHGTLFPTLPAASEPGTARRWSRQLAAARGTANIPALGASRQKPAGEAATAAGESVQAIDTERGISARARAATTRRRSRAMLQGVRRCNESGRGCNKMGGCCNKKPTACNRNRLACNVRATAADRTPWKGRGFAYG